MQVISRSRNECLPISLG